MQLFHIAFSGQDISPLAPNGSLLSAGHRLESLFHLRELRVLVNEEDVRVCDHKGRPLRNETPMQSLQAFTAFMDTARIHRAALSIRNPLRLSDCWDEDPVGSGGLALFADNASLDARQKKELKELFHPYSGIVYPQDIFKKNSIAELVTVAEELHQDPFFSKEIQRRRHALGETRFKDDFVIEMAWLRLTKRLMTWAAKEGYDGFVFQNKLEDNGADNFMPLTAEQLRVEQVLAFDTDAYLKAAAPNFSARLKAIAGFQKETTGEVYVKDVFFNPASPTDRFWMPLGPQGRRASPPHPENKS
jgi:hypothetical protein